MKVGVVGASGYSGGELLKLLADHSKFEVSYIAAGSNAGELISSVHPQLTMYEGQKFQSTQLAGMADCDLVFFALPHGESAHWIAQLGEGVKVVDLGADFRLEDSSQWEKYYGGKYAGSFPYGLPELPGARPTIASSKKVANPGCYATSIILGSLPAITHNLIDSTDLVVVAASGTTGAGRSAKVNLLGSEVMGSLSSYKFGGIHQHTPEIEQALKKVSGKNVGLSFTPILAPMPRGILTTITAKINGPLNTAKVHEIYSEAFAPEAFVHVLPIGQMPQTNAVSGTNSTHIQIAVDEHAKRLIISVALDNLGKGAAHQALQNANIMCGFREDEGLPL